jgi:TRAP-type C4-dicarboxylate transport system substrate-binding protein
MRGPEGGRRLGPMNRALLLATALAATAALPGGCSFGGSDRVGGEQAATPRVLTLLNPFTSQEELTDFVTEVARLSDGELKIRLVRAGYAQRPDFEAATINDMRQGRADLAMAGTRAWDEFGARSLRALNAPLLIDSYPLEERVLGSDLVAPMLGELRGLGLAGIGILPGPMRRPLGFGHRLAGPDDYRNMTVGVQQSRLAAAVLRELGARPRRLRADRPSREGLDGVEYRVGGIEADRFDVAGSHLTANVELWPRSMVLFANAKSYRALTAGQRRILRTAAANVVPKLNTAARNSELESSGNICRRGKAAFDAATPGELRELRRALKPVFHDLERDPGTRAAIEGIKRMKARLAEPPAELPRCDRAPERTAVGATALDGVWEADTDRSAAGAEGLAENWGHWIYAFDRGRFAITQENRESCTWGYGRFTVDGNRMSWTFTDGGGIAPNEAQNKPGEFFVFGFSAYRDTLTVTPVKGKVSPRGFRDKPWRRLSESPTNRFFSKRCPPPADALPG